MNKKDSKKKNRVYNLQKLYAEDKLMSDEFYKEITNQIKFYLMRYLIKKGYYKEGVLQTNFSQEEVIDCYTYVMNHITGTFVMKSNKKSLVKYDPSKSNIATYIHTWCKGFSSSILARQHKEHKYNAHKILVLDDILVSHTPYNFTIDGVYLPLEEIIDQEIFLDNVVRYGIKTETFSEIDMEDFKHYNTNQNMSSIIRKFSS